MKNYSICRVEPHLDQITLVPPMEGFGDFITAWVYREKEALLIDTGPAVTAPALLSALADIDCRPDYILLTHIHIDHAGGLGRVSDAFPHTPVICHAKAIPHLTNPEKLWQGTKLTLGAMADAYGPFAPVPETRLVDAATLPPAGVFQPVMTPGHAVHHISYLMADHTLFAGEAGGINIDFGNNLIYMRPATPPRFHLDVTVASLDRLIETKPRCICYGHGGMRTDAMGLLQRHRQQLFLWKEIIEDEMAKGDAGNLDRRCAARLLKEDRLLAGLTLAGPAVFRREKFFMQNSIAGFIGYLQDGRNTG